MRTEWTVTITLFDHKCKTLSTITEQVWADTKYEAEVKGIGKAIRLYNESDKADYWTVNIA